MTDKARTASDDLRKFINELNSYIDKRISRKTMATADPKEDHYLQGITDAVDRIIERWGSDRAKWPKSSDEIELADDPAYQLALSLMDAIDGRIRHLKPESGCNT